MCGRCKKWGEKDEKVERVMLRRIKVGRERVAIVFVYSKRGEEEGLRVIWKYMKEKNEKLMLIVGDMEGRERDVSKKFEAQGTVPEE